MAWFSGKVSLGNFPDLAGAVNKLSESVKNIEKNFDTALGFEGTSSSTGEGLWHSSFMGNNSGESTVESLEKSESIQPPLTIDNKEDDETDMSPDSAAEQTASSEVENEEVKIEKDQEYPEESQEKDTVSLESGVAESDSNLVSLEPQESSLENVQTLDSVSTVLQKEVDSENSPTKNSESRTNEAEVDHVEASAAVVEQVESNSVLNLDENADKQKVNIEDAVEKIQFFKDERQHDSQEDSGIEPSDSNFVTMETKNDSEFSQNDLHTAAPNDEASETVSESVSHANDANIKVVDVDLATKNNETDIEVKQLNSGSKQLNSGSKVSDSDSVIELDKVKREMKMMEAALQGAARQAQAKADEIAKFMNENEQLKAVIQDLERKSNEAEIESMREEYHQRVAALERKVYALTKERDTLRREQSRKSDSAALLKEKDEIINQVMAEGEELSKKQASQEGLIRKLRAQIRELEEEKKGVNTKLQVEENKVESIKKDKAATEKLLQETIEKHQTELAAQKEYYTNALAAAKEAEALAEARANSEARTELESRLREAEDREAMLVQTLEELRQTLSRTEQQAVFREDMLRRDIEDIQKRYQASERRCEELITQVPESTRPLLRQIEAMQETTARRAEAWTAVERSLNSRLQEAEAKAAGAEERERAVNERLSQTLSRINVLEAQISCLRTEQTQLSRSLEKERQRASENRQEYLAAKEEADTQEGRANQLEEEIREHRQKHKKELHEALMHGELLQREVEREKAARLDLERTARSIAPEQTSITKHSPALENGNLSRRPSSTSSQGSMEESYYLQASLDSSDSFSERRKFGETTMNPYYMKSMTPSAFEATLRQKEGELASYMSRLASLESIRDSLAEELVKMTAQCEKLQAEAAMLPSIRAELEALRRRHSAALELMGERDEELEELRADIVDLKEMYREQVNLLVNKIQVMGPSLATI